MRFGLDITEIIDRVGQVELLAPKEIYLITGINDVAIYTEKYFKLLMFDFIGQQKIIKRVTQYE